MRLIPGKTKVQIEIFKSVTISDLLVGSVLAAILIFIATGNLPYKWVFAAVHAVISVILLSKLDSESNYLYLLNILRHYGFYRKFDKADTDDFLLRMSAENKKDVFFDEIFTKQKASETDEVQSVQASEDAKLSEADQPDEGEDDIFADAENSEPAEASDKKADKKSKKKQKDNKDKKSAAKTEKKKSEKKKSNSNYEDIEELTAYSEISGGFIKYKNGYYGAAFRIPDVEFRFFSQMRRDNSIENGLGAVIRMFRGDLCTNIVKIERPIEYDSYVEDVYDKINELKRAYEHNFMNEDEMKARLAVLYTRLEQLKQFQGETRIVVPFYYLVVYDKDVNRLGSQLSYIADTLTRAEMKPKRLDDKELALMLKYSNGIDFDEKLINNIRPEDYAKWAMPDSVEFTPRKTIVNGIITHNFRVISYPMAVGDAWLASILTLPSTKVVIKMQAMDSSEAIKAIDRSMSELRGTIATARTDSQAIDAQTHLETLQEMLITLKNNNESLYNVNIYVTAYDITATGNDPKLLNPGKSSLRSPMNNMKRMVKSLYSEQGFKLNNMEFMQASAYIGGQITAYDPCYKKGRGIPSNTIAACFPWIFPIVMDDKGMYLGTSEGVPVFIDFFRRDHERVNSNLVIIGKSGSGKSFSIKTVLANLAADDSKIFVLDPEGEYTELAENLHGQFINVATNQNGILNPFHIIASLDDEDGEASGTSYANHLQFLEEFFKQILPDCDKDSLEYLNTLVDIIYKRRGIDSKTDISKLRPEDYPIFDDLYDEILLEFQRSSNEYLRTMLRTLMNYISKFSQDGRNATIWNGPSSITTDHNFTVFNFQSLLANRNSLIANAQLLLVLKYIDNEIIKNRDYNAKYGLNRKVVVVIDEAHVFIDTKYPIALDFMFQLAKRIRKYNGMQIVITQNIKDFVGSEEIARKSTAIINACQYSFIFSLAPNDMGDLCKLYEKAGGINEVEQEQIVQAARGRAFTVLSPASRTSFAVSAHPQLRKMFETKYQNPYFDGIGSEENWIAAMGDSIEKRIENAKLEQADELKRAEAKEIIPRFNFTEIDESEYEQQNAEIKPEEITVPEVQHELEETETASIKETVAPAVSGDSFTNTLLSGVVEKLGEISLALAKNSVSSAPSSSSETAVLAEEIRRLTEKLSSGENKNIFGAVAENGNSSLFAPFDNLPSESESSASIGSIFDVLRNAEPQSEPEAGGISESDVSAAEVAAPDIDNNYNILEFITQAADVLEQENSDKIGNFLNSESPEDRITVSIEDLLVFNKNVAAKKAEGKKEMYA